MISDVGFRMWEVGCSMSALEFGTWEFVLSAQCLVLSAGCRVPGTRKLEPGTWNLELPTCTSQKNYTPVYLFFMLQNFTFKS